MLALMVAFDKEETWAQVKKELYKQTFIEKVLNLIEGQKTGQGLAIYPKLEKIRNYMNSHQDKDEIQAT